MVEHLVLAVQSSNGKITLNECMNTPEKFPALKRFLMSPRSLLRNFVNTIVGEGLKPLVFQSLDLAKENLKVEVENFDWFFKENPSATTLNVTFGPLNYDEWIIFHNKHFTHHFSQFGLLDN